MSGSSIARAALLIASLCLSGGAALAAPVSPLHRHGRFMVGRRRAEHNGRRAGATALPRGRTDVAGAGDAASAQSEMRQRELQFRSGERGRVPGRRDFGLMERSQPERLRDHFRTRRRRSRRGRGAGDSFSAQPVVDDARQQTDGVDPAAGDQHHGGFARAQPALTNA